MFLIYLLTQEVGVKREANPSYYKESEVQVLIICPLLYIIDLFINLLFTLRKKAVSTS